MNMLLKFIKTIITNQDLKEGQVHEKKRKIVSFNKSLINIL